MRASRLAVLAAGAVFLSVGTAGGAYGVFSADVADSQAVRAGTVVVDNAGPEPAVLHYIDLVPGVPKADHLPLRYSGTVAADLFLELDPEGDTPFCRVGTGGGWEPLPGGGLEIRVHGGQWVDYCSLFDGGRSLTLGEGLAPDTALDVGIDVQLRPGSDDQYSGLDDSDRLTVQARESDSTAGFFDRLVGSIEISTGASRPVVPQHCIDAGLTDFDADHTIYLTGGDDSYETGKPAPGGRGFVVFGLGGDDHIVGSNQADCIDGGSGDDELWGANQRDVVIGGRGNDVLNNPDGEGEDTSKSNGKDRLYGGDGDDVIYGGNAKDSLSGDSLYGENGDDVLVGGRGTDLWDGGGQVTRDVCIDTSGEGNDRIDQFQDCESIVRDPQDHPLAEPTATEETALTAP